MPGPIIPQPRSFTVEYHRRQNILTTPVKISEVFKPGSSKTQNFVETVGIWDTGATGSVITKEIIDSLKLKPIGNIEMRGVHGSKIVNTYLINIALPNGVEIVGVKATEAKQLSGNLGALIGMDIINHGDLAITNCGGKTIMTFRVPPIEKIDFNKDRPLTRQQRRRIFRKNQKKI